MPDTTDSHAEVSWEGSGRLIDFPHGSGSKPPPDNNLPLQLTSFIGREREISDLKRLLTTEARLVTLTGPGGSGKTRLALSAASAVAEHFEDGVWWVELAPLSDPQLVPQAVASVLEVQESSGRSLTEAIADDLKDLEILLVWDNCEHVVQACARLAQVLLNSSPGLRILTTSREVSGIGGETQFPVPPLPSPGSREVGIGELEGFESVRLFLERAKYRVPDFALNEKNAAPVAEVCARLDGIPLAIELAAARVGMLSVEQISVRLKHSFGLLSGRDRTAPERQRTMRGVLDWSYELLDGEEREVFGRLSVFAGGFTLEAAEAVCGGDGIDSEEVLDLLSHLVDKSLVLVARRSGEVRYRLLEPARQYGWEKLRRSGGFQQTRERHTRYFLALAEEAEPELSEQRVWLERLGTEHGNFRAALGWTLDEEDAEVPGGKRAELGLGLAAALAQARFWHAYGQSEGRRWLEKGLAETTSSLTPVRAKALRETGWLATHQGDYERAMSLLEESRSIFEELGDRPGVATSLVYLGHLALHGGNYERVKALVRDAEVLRDELADRQAIARLLYLLGAGALSGGEHERAITFLQEGLALNRELGDSWDACICLTFLGIIALELGDPEQAEALYGESLRLLQGLGDKTGISYGLRGMACAASLRKDAVRAARLWGAAEAASQTIGLPLSPFDHAHPDYEGLLASARSLLDDEEAWEGALAQGRTMPTEEAINYALEPDEPAPAPDDAVTPLLSGREVEVLRLVARGLTNPQIAQRLYLSPRTVGQHLRSVYRKLGVSSRAAAAREAIDHKLI